MRRARIAVAAIFFINGFVYASWVPRLAEIQTALDLSEGDLGLALLMIAIGSIAAMPTSGGLIARYGSRALTRLTAVLFGVSLPLIGLAGGFASLCLAFLFYGAAAGVLDVSMNAQGIAVERAYRRPIMSSLHGMFSTGAMAGAGVTALLASQEVGMMAQFLVVAALTVVLGFVFTRVMLPASADAGGHAQGFVLPGRKLLVFGAIAFCGLLGEGAIGDWSAVYLSHSLGADVQVAALAFAAFSVMMALGRFSGDWIVARFGEAVVVSGGGVLAALGLGGTLLIGQPLVAIVGLAMVGAGLSCVFPVTLSAATRTPGVTPGTAIAGVCTIGYGAFLLGPPAIGGLAELTSLPTALGLVVMLFVLIATLGPRTARRQEPATASA